MPHPRKLGEFELILLLAILQLGDEAYGAALLREIEERTERHVALGAIYKTLERLEGKGLVSSWVGTPTSERGGRRRRYYSVEALGRSALGAALSDLRSMAQGLETQWRVP